MTLSEDTTRRKILNCIVSYFKPRIEVINAAYPIL